MKVIVKKKKKAWGCSSVLNLPETPLESHLLRAAFFLHLFFLNKHRICSCRSSVLESTELTNFDFALLYDITSSLADPFR